MQHTHLLLENDNVQELIEHNQLDTMKDDSIIEL